MTAVLLASFAVLVLLLWGYALWRLGVAERDAIADRATSHTQAGSRHVSQELEAWMARTVIGRRLRRRIERAGLSWRVIDVAVGILALSTAAYLILATFISWWVALLTAAATVQLWLAYFDRREVQRREAFIAQLPEIARVLSNSTSAGLALRSAIRMAAEDMAEPARSELTHLSGELDLGTSLVDALAGMQDRLPSRELSLLTRTLVIQSRAGGTVVSVLRDIAETLDARKDLRREIRTVLSGAVFTSWIVLVLGVGSLVMMNAIAPGTLNRMTTSLVGQLVLAAAGGLFALGFFLIRRTTRIEV